MSENIFVPVLGESITEATVSKWLKKSGDKVNADEAIVELETDKVNLEVPSPISGILSEIRTKEGETVQVGALLGVVSGDEKTDTKTKVETIDKTSDQNKNVVSFEKNKTSEPKIFEEKEVEEPLILTEEPLKLTEEIQKEEVLENNNINLSPAVRKIVEEKNIDTSKVEGTGKDGRILKGDLINLMSSNPLPNQRKLEKGQEERVKMTRLRQTIAKRLKEAQENAAMLTTFNEVDMLPIKELRSKYGQEFEKQHGIKLGFMGFFVIAAVQALKKFPIVNASIDGSDVVYHGYQDIGVAVSTDRGLVVPIIKDADTKSLPELEKSILEYSEKARDSKLTIDEMQGGTFTISNGGVFGSLLSTPILNAPQTAILGMHAIQERPVAVNGEIVIRPMMYLAMSYDHRLLDGKEAVRFLVSIKEQLESPERLLLNL